jgi:hypothetical protein
MYAITRAIRTDLPESIESYLNIPWWYAATRRINGQRTAAEELTAQLELLEHDLTGTADQVYGTDTQRLRDQTRYLEERTSPREPDIPGRAARQYRCLISVCSAPYERGISAGRWTSWQAG